jgi:tripeptidyl-peptidase-1
MELLPRTAKNIDQAGNMLIFGIGPDFSTQSEYFRIFFNGNASVADGTSLAVPAFAGIISLLNDAPLSSGKPSLGFLNPLLYSKALVAFNDITAGSNPGCGTTEFNVEVSFFVINH